MRSPLPSMILAAGLALAIVPPGMHAQDAIPAEALSSDYKVSPQDVLLVEIVGEVALPREFRVSAEGDILYPFIEKVRVAGRTPSEIGSIIKQRLIGEDYFVDPQVVVNVKDYQVRTVNVFGEVNRPGPVTLPGEKRIDLVDAITMANGPTKLAKKSAVKLTRKGVSKTYSLDDLIKIQDPAKKIWLEPGDVIEVPQSFF